jgi:hypothetical protein
VALLPTTVTHAIDTSLGTSYGSVSSPAALFLQDASPEYHHLVSGPATTDDGRYFIIDGRRWRATDPSIPEDRRIELVGILMAWRREVRRVKGTAQEPVARAGVQAAKVALGERGSPPWWEQTDQQRRARWQAQVAEPS